MSDKLNLSLWPRNFNAETALGHFTEVLRLFPFSRLRLGIRSVRIYAIEYQEPPIAEQAYADAVELADVVELCRDFENPDCGYIVDGWWDLWRYEQSWELAPVPVSLACFAPEFENSEMGDPLRLELGTEDDFLPQSGAPQYEKKAQSNLASLVRLARDIGKSMTIERRSLWSESGESFAERLDEAFAIDADE